MERITKEEIEEIFPVPDDKQKNLKLSSKEERVLIKMLNALEFYAEQELKMAKRSRNHWLINYEGTVEEAEEGLKAIREWVDHFKNRLGD